MNAVFAVVYSKVAGFPEGSVVTNIKVTITGAATAAITQDVAPDTADVTFANVPPDTYTFSISAIDASGNVFGTPVTTDASGNATFVVAAPATVTLSLPSSVAVSVA